MELNMNMKYETFQSKCTIQDLFNLSFYLGESVASLGLWLQAYLNFASVA